MKSYMAGLSKNNEIQHDTFNIFSDIISVINKTFFLEDKTILQG